MCVCVCAGSLGCRGDQARCFSNLAFAFSQLGDEEEAAESFIIALQGFRDTGNIRSLVCNACHCNNVRKRNVCVCVCVCVCVRDGN